MFRKTKLPLRDDFNVVQESNAYSEYALNRIINDLSQISRLIESYDYDEECFIYEPFYKIKEDVNGL